MKTRIWTSLTLALALVLALSGSLSAVNITVAPVPDATHEFVCECDCGGETQTYDWFKDFACSRYDDIKCEYDNGSESTLSGCTKKAQPKDASVLPFGQKLAAPGVSVGSIGSGGVAIGPHLPYQPYPVDFGDFDIPSGDEYVTWLDGISANLFGSTFPGLVLFSKADTVGQTYSGTTAVNPVPFSLDVTKVDQQDIELGYIDPDTFKAFDVEFVWLRGTLSTGSGVEYVEGLGITATEISDPSNTLTIFTPYNTMYPFTTAKSQGLEIGLEPLEEMTLSFSKARAARGEEGDACQACKDDGNGKIKDMKRDLKSCLKWKAGAATLVGGLAGSLAGGVGAFGGAIALGGVAAGYCADTALDTYGDIVEDFCSCFSANDCGDHEACVEA